MFCRLQVRFVLQPVGPIDLRGALQQYCKTGTTATRPVEAYTAVKNVLEVKNIIKDNTYFCFRSVIQCSLRIRSIAEKPVKCNNG